jgi:hypothetical protein
MKKNESIQKIASFLLLLTFVVQPISTYAVFGVGDEVTDPGTNAGVGVDAGTNSAQTEKK